MYVSAAAAAAFLASLLLEAVADEQQWAFQQSKRGAAPRVAAWRDDYGRGFLTHGAFAWSRHPNFFAEQCVWWSFSLFGAAAGGVDAAWAATGAFLLSLLFLGSTQFTEDITAAKYPSYARYQATVSRLLPLPPPRKMAAKK